MSRLEFLPEPEPGRKKMAGEIKHTSTQRESREDTSGSSDEMNGNVVAKDASARRKALLVLGMHRSGTSAFTRVLSLMGATLPSQLVAPQPDNIVGFWESDDIVTIHEELLASAGSSWHDVLRFPNHWMHSDAAQVFKHRILDILGRDFSTSSLFVLKDPRMCRLVPFWLSVLEEFGAEPLFVIPVRNPLEVAASLKARNDFSPGVSLLLWLRHFLTAERDTRKYTRSFVSYEGLLQDWRATVERIGADLRISWPCCSGEAATEIECFLSDRHRHHVLTYDDVQGRPDVIDWVKRTCDWAIRAAELHPTETETMDAIRAELDIADCAFGPIVAELHTQVAERDRGLAALHAQVTERDRGLAALHAQVVERDTELAARDAELIAKQAELGARTREIELLKQTKVFRLRDAILNEPLSFQKLLTIGWLVGAIVTEALKRSVRSLVVRFRRY